MEMRCLSVTIGGGEPLARSDFWELLAEARRRRGGAIDPVTAFRESGYRAQKAIERPAAAASLPAPTHL